MDQDEISITPDKDQEMGNNNDSDDNEEYSLEEDTWIEWFCKMDGNHFFVEISHEFLRNKMNFLGIEKVFPNYEDYLGIIMAKEAPTSEILNEEYMEKMGKIKELYGLLHKRFLYTGLGNSFFIKIILNLIYRIITCKRKVFEWSLWSLSKNIMS